MASRRLLKSCSIGNKRVGPPCYLSDCRSGSRTMTDFTVVVVLCFVIGRACEKNVVTQTVSLRRLVSDESRVCPSPAQTNSLRYGSGVTWLLQTRDYVLMLVVGKLDQELAWCGGVPKREANIVSRRNLRVANRTDDRLRSFEKLRTMATDACIVARVVGNVRKASYFFPVVRRNFVAGVASSLMSLCGVREPGIVDRRWPSSCPVVNGSPAPLFLG